MKDALPALGEKASGFKEIPFGKALQAGDYRVECSCVRCETPIVAEVLPFAKGKKIDSDGTLLWLRRPRRCVYRRRTRS